MSQTKPFVVPLQIIYSFSKSDILDRSYRSLKQNLHSVVYQHSVVPLPAD